MSYIAQVLEKDRSKEKVNHIIAYIGNDKTRVKELMDLVLGLDKKAATHAAWVLYHLVENKNADFSPYFDKSVEMLVNGCQQAIERALLRMFWMMDSWPEEHFAKLVDFMMNTIIDTKSKIAAQALSMEALLKHLSPYPELLQELALVVEEGMPYGSAGYKAKGRKLVKAIRKKY